MPLRCSIFPVCLIVCLSLGGLAAAATPDFKKDIEPILSKYCYDCHADGADKGDFVMDDYQSLEKHMADLPLWLRVWENSRSQLMPPSYKKQPSDEQRRLLAEWIEQKVFKLDHDNPDPGRVTIRRLNRQEYENTVKDLFGVDFDAEDSLPPDDTGYGFDTIGDVLSISPMLMEKYLAAANNIVSKAVRPQQATIPIYSIIGEKFESAAPSKMTGKYLPFNQGAVVTSKYVIDHPGEYKVTVEYNIGGSSEASDHTATLTTLVNGMEASDESVGWDNRKSITFSTKALLTDGENLLSFRIAEKAPPKEDDKPLNMSLLEVTLQGPLDGGHKIYPSDYYRVFFKGGPPADANARETYARDILRRIADRAFRRPVDESTLDRLVKLANHFAKDPKATFESGIAQATTAILASPRFLFRSEVQPEPDNPGRAVPLDEFALASRLSYFLWSSMPDTELFDLAKKGELRENLDDEIDRMLADSKSQRFIKNFVGQWLLTRDVEGINVDPRRVLGIKNQEEAFKVFGSRQRRAMRLETESLFAYLLKENRSVLELFTADYTFMNEHLAKFYGIPGVNGDSMQKISLPKGSHRGGILTHGSLLLVTSNPTRTSPVKRGLFVLENLLGTPAPPAPPNVPTLEEAKRAHENSTMREIMEIHREKTLCASCHARMDPIGLALENFNAIGMYRTEENGKPIDTAGRLITGESFSNVEQLSHIMTTSRRKDFYRCLVSKMLTYAIGRGTEYYDTPTIDRIVAGMEEDGGKLRTVVRGIIHSAPFQKRRGDGSLR